MKSLWTGRIVLFFTIIFILFILFFLTGSAGAQTEQDNLQSQQTVIFKSNSPPYFNYFAPPRQHRFSQNYLQRSREYYYQKQNYLNRNYNYYPNYYPQGYYQHNFLPRYLLP